MIVVYVSSVEPTYGASRRTARISRTSTAPDAQKTSAGPASHAGHEQPAVDLGDRAAARRGPSVRSKSAAKFCSTSRTPSSPASARP